MRHKITRLAVSGLSYAPKKWSTLDFPQPNRIYFIYGGSAFITYRGEEYRLLQGRLYFFPAGIEFNLRQDPLDRLLHMYFNFDMLPPIITASKRFFELTPGPGTLLFHTVKALECIMLDKTRWLETSGSRNGMLYPGNARAASYLENLMEIVDEAVGAESMTDPDILRVLELIAGRYGGTLTVEDMASAACLDRSYFIRKFKIHMGTTPFEYLQNLRLSVAAELLESGSTLSAAAAETGYSNASSLCHALTKRRGRPS